MIKQIISKSNPTIKDILKIKQHKASHDLVLIEGERFIYEAYKRGKKLYSILFEDPPHYIDELNCDKIEITHEIASLLSNTINTSGVFAVVEYKEQAFAMPKGKFLILDKIADPGNLGTIIRTALAFGFTDIYLYNCVDYKNDKVLRSTMGTIFDVNLYQVSIQQLELLSKFCVINADMSGMDMNKFTKKVDGIILGNEANGVSKEVSLLTKNVVSIPMKNEVESLNVAIAGAILMNKFSN